MTSEEVAQKIAELQKVRAELLASAEAHEHQARDDRRKATAAKKEIAEWATALQSIRVKEIIVTDQQAAAKARAEAEESAKRIAEKEKRLDELLKASEPKPE